MLLFDSFEFDRRLLRAIDHIGWDMPTPVQEEAIPVALSGRDLLACARTGSGKTGGFVLPALQRLLKRGLTPGFQADTKGSHGTGNKPGVSVVSTSPAAACNAVCFDFAASTNASLTLRNVSPPMW